MARQKITSFEQLKSMVVQTGGQENWRRYGAVNSQIDGDLIKFTYDASMVGEADWNWFETVSRGLILNRKTGEIVARPFDKFWNYLENGRTPDKLAHITHIFEKADGSFGILFRENGHYRVTTHGSFWSEQGVWATRFLNQYYDLTGLPDNLTLMFEIIYPENRIVVDYGDTEDLVLLNVRDRHSGRYLDWYSEIVPLANRYGFTLPRVYGFNSVSDILAATGDPEFQNMEGWVVQFSDGTRWKFKVDFWLHMHRLMMHFSFRRVLAAYIEGRHEDYREELPEEIQPEFDRYLHIIENEVRKKEKTVNQLWSSLKFLAGDRKTYAKAVMSKHRNISSLLFAKLDDKLTTADIAKSIDWDSVNK